MFTNQPICRLALSHEILFCRETSRLVVDGTSLMGCVFRGSCSIANHVNSGSFYILTRGEYVIDRQTDSCGVFEQVVATIKREGVVGRDEVRFDRAVLEGLLGSKSIEYVAGRCFLSMSTFKRYFTSWYGTSPHKWFMRNRLAIARMVIMRSDITIKRIAEAVGFVNNSHFCCCYKRYYGESPNATRNALRKERTGAPHINDMRPLSGAYVHALDSPSAVCSVSR